MNMVLKDKPINKIIRKIINILKYSVDGLKFAYKYEQSMTLHFITTITFVAMGIILNITLLEWSVCILVLGLIAATELINTSIEAVVDLTTTEIHPIAKIAKDTSSAAVFIFSLVAFISFLIIFVPKIIVG